MSLPDAWIETARATPIERVIDERGIRLRGRIERVGPCPACGGTDRFSINTKKQCFNCRGFGGGDVIALVQHLDGCDFVTACTTLAGERPRNGARHKPDPEREQRLREQRERQADEARKDERSRLEHAARIWNEAQPIAGTSGEAYLMERGITLDDVPERGGLRFHPHCVWENGTAPCVLARFTDAITGEPKGIHRRPITGETPKSLGPVKGCVIRLWPDEDVSEGLVIGEGVETTLAAAVHVVRHNTHLRPAWAVGCAGNLVDFPVLPGITTLTILVDHDANGVGQSKAQECARRWCAAGREVIRLMPAEAGADFNDLVKPP